MRHLPLSGSGPWNAARLLGSRDQLCSQDLVNNTCKLQNPASLLPVSCQEALTVRGVFVRFTVLRLSVLWIQGRQQQGPGLGHDLTQPHGPGKAVSATRGKKMSHARSASPCPCGLKLQHAPNRVHRPLSKACSSSGGSSLYPQPPPASQLRLENFGHP